MQPEAMPAYAQQSPVCLLIAALGGEGGGVLTDWIVKAAMAEDLPVQSTSIPGVAQRTGATTYYIEVFPIKQHALAGQTPIMALYPGPGNIDLMVATELLEVGRALENGYVSPDRTTLLGSTHRIYSIAEKMAMSDARYAGQAVLDSASKLAKHAVLLDLAKLAEDNNTAINAVLLGAIAGLKRLPISAETFANAVREAGIAVTENLRGFELGMTCVQNQTEIKPAINTTQHPAEHSNDALSSQIHNAFPTQTWSVLQLGVDRLCDYQDAAYAKTYLDRLSAIVALDHSAYTLTIETARQLALWMSYEDVIRVADLKIRPERFQKLRTELRAQAHEPVHIREFVKPGIDEIAALLPPRMGARVLRWAEQRANKQRFNFSMRVKTHTVSGFLRLYLLAKLRPWRRRSLRFQQEQRLIERWLKLIKKTAAMDYSLALELVECAGLNKGYSETFERGRGNFLRILDTVVEPAIEQRWQNATQHLAAARQAALTDPEGKSLDRVLDSIQSKRFDDVGSDSM